MGLRGLSRVREGNILMMGIDQCLGTGRGWGAALGVVRFA